jgi:hypothetical protein
MLHITLGPRVPADVDDGLGRKWVGYDDKMSEAELFEANRGCWRLGPRADSEQYGLVSYKGEVKQAFEIDRIITVPVGGRRAIEGRPLTAGHPVYDEFVGGPSPVSRVRNPITYFDARDHRRGCACGCGEEVARGYFLPGHDQRAIHDRVARVGTVMDFIRWFDEVHPQTSG